MNKFKHLILTGRPASGKSEFIDFMKKVSDNDRINRYHIGPFEEMDDFVWLWEKFMEDGLWKEAGHEEIWSHVYNGNPGLKTDRGEIFDFLMAKFNREIKKYKRDENFYKGKTLFIEFSRGGNDAYANAFSRLSDDVLKNAAVLYIKVTAEESWRRNVARYEEKKKHSILAHMVPREVMDAFYKVDDWDKFTNNQPHGFINRNDLKIPFVTMNNEPELKDNKLLDERYGAVLNKLWELYAT